MSDTPRTDAKSICIQMCSRREEIMTDFARGLERELAVMADERDEMLIGLEKLGWPVRLVELPEYCRSMGNELLKVREELDAMTAAKNKALNLAKAFSERLESRECDRCDTMHCRGEAECFARTRKLIAELENT